MKTKSIGKPFPKAKNRFIPKGKKEGELKAPRLKSLNLLSESSRLERLKKARRQEL